MTHDQSGHTHSDHPGGTRAKLGELARSLSLALRGERANEVETDLAPYLDILAAIKRRDLARLSSAELTTRARRMADDARAGGDERTLGGREIRSLEVDLFGLVCEASRRGIGLDPFDVQIIAGLAMARGRVVELPTGEGKTLAAVFPAALHALGGRGVHVLTFNDYLARRDAAWMGPVYDLLGLSVGCVQEGMDPAARREAYSRDVTYLTAKEAGFDLLRDGLCLESEEQVQRPFHMALIDEADSILIDEARTPLVIAGTGGGEQLPPTCLSHLADLARRLSRGVDFQIDEGERNVYLTDKGTTRVEGALGRSDLFTEEGAGLLAAVRNALHAEHLLRRDVDYIVRGGIVELVDELTGRVADNRHWPDGLHAAVEVKEQVSQGESGTILGSIALQHFLRLYPLLCGMTATAASAADELWELYGLPVVVVPPNRPCVRTDESDLIFADRATRDEAVIAEVARAQGAGRPVLVGTASVADSERLAAGLVRSGVKCEVLNARNDEREAAIIAEAGDLRRVTISTNMAGRGTDIRLGGMGERNRERAIALGGLYVIGTTRHDSLRIDRQLRGRAGRQGDPGTTRLFVSLEDDLLRRAGIERLIPAALYPRGVDRPLDSPIIHREVARAQRIAENECTDARRRLYDYSEVIEVQRREIRALRQDLLERRSIPHLLEERCPDRWTRLLAVAGEPVLRSVERRATLLAIDQCWAEYLADMQALRDEIHLVALGGDTPLVEFTRTASAHVEKLRARIDDTVVGTFRVLKITAEGVDWNARGLRSPSATWTYLIHDTAFAPNMIRALAHHASFALWAAILWAPLLFGWGLYLHWRQRRRPDLLRLKELAKASRSLPGDAEDIAFLEARRARSRK
jgi:preprotein translocase subunit SecA